MRVLRPVDFEPGAAEVAAVPGPGDAPGALLVRRGELWSGLDRSAHVVTAIQRWLVDVAGDLPDPVIPVIPDEPGGSTHPLDELAAIDAMVADEVAGIGRHRVALAQNAETLHFLSRRCRSRARAVAAAGMLGALLAAIDGPW